MSSTEKERLQILMQCGVLDSEINEADYTSITSAATRLLKVAMSSVTMIASDRLWLKSTFGFSLSELPRSGTFANHVSELSDPTDMFVVLDAQKIDLYKDYLPVKNPPYIRFYAGTPIVVEGHIVGSLCVFDPIPRKRLTVSERMNLLDLAHATSILLTERRNRVISNTSAVDRLVSHLLHDSLSLPLQEMTSSLSLLRPIASASSSSRSSRSSSRDYGIGDLSHQLSEKSKLMLSLDIDSVDNNEDTNEKHTVEEDHNNFNITVQNENFQNNTNMTNNMTTNMTTTTNNNNNINQGTERTNCVDEKSTSQNHDDSMHDVFVALSQLSSLIGTKFNLQNTPTPSQIDQEPSTTSSTQHRIQIPLRFTTSSNGCEYLDQYDSDTNSVTTNKNNQALKNSNNGNIIINNTNNNGLIVNPELCLQSCIPTSTLNSQIKIPSIRSTGSDSRSQTSETYQVQRLPSFSNYVYTNMSSDLNDMLVYLQQVLPVSVSNYRTIWNIILPPNLFQQPNCQQTKCIIYLMDVLTNILETVMTHIIMRTNQMEVTVNINQIPCGNSLEQEFLPTNSKGYLLNEVTIIPAEVVLSVKAVGYMNTFYGGHVTVEPKVSDTTQEGDNQQNDNSIRQLQYDFFIDNVSIQEILSPLGVQTTWKLSDNENKDDNNNNTNNNNNNNNKTNTINNTNNSNEDAESKPITYYERNPGVLNYIVTVPCRLEMTYLPPEEVEKLNQNITTTTTTITQNKNKDNVDNNEKINVNNQNKDTNDTNNNIVVATNLTNSIVDNSSIVDNTTIDNNNTTTTATNTTTTNNNNTNTNTNSGENTTNIVTIPVNTNENLNSNNITILPEIQKEKNHVTIQPLSKLRVLIVDDSPAIQKILGKWLLRNDCEVTSALNGQLGVEALQTADHVFDIVFMDFLMPVMDGIEAIRTYMEWKSTSDAGKSGKYDQTLIIGLSATANVEEQQQGIKVGMHYFIQKPADTKLLRVIIDWKLQQLDVNIIAQRLMDGVVLT